MNSYLRLLAASMLVTGSATAQDGMIHFVGAISEPACRVSPSAAHIAIDCIRNGIKKTASVPHNRSAAGTPWDLAEVSSQQQTGQRYEIQVVYR
ncbi:hypothetical protein [Pantoea sp. 1.19]|uniref:hypothetical protein n=1 Tax=Pantoea sp. 1.19 TaxID=1925589 RepID=UPI0011151FDD|nr:hypothetical protein [Pantoea sp. 1.19]